MILYAWMNWILLGCNVALLVIVIIKTLEAKFLNVNKDATFLLVWIAVNLIKRMMWLYPSLSFDTRIAQLMLHFISTNYLIAYFSFLYIKDGDATVIKKLFKLTSVIMLYSSPVIFLSCVILDKLIWSPNISNAIVSVFLQYPESILLDDMIEIALIINLIQSVILVFISQKKSFEILTFLNLLIILVYLLRAVIDDFGSFYELMVLSIYALFFCTAACYITIANSVIRGKRL
jgi:hypothetical protein